MSASKQKSGRTKRRPSKERYLGKFVELAGSPSSRTPLSVLSRVYTKLWKFQKSAVSFTLKKKGCLLAMEMGTGKTLTTLASLAKRHYWGSVDRVLVVCPAAALYVWEREIKKWLKGTTLRFVIVSFDFARFYFKYMKKEAFDALVVDESHKLKNPNSAQSRRIWRSSLYIPFKYGLTGTPIADTVMDLFGQFRVINSDLLGEKYTTFRKKYCRQTGYMGFETVLTTHGRREILRVTSPETYQVLKKDVFGAVTLPPVRFYAQLKGTQKKLYDQLSNELVARHGDYEISATRKITQMIRLQQITGGHVSTDDEEKLIFECGKGDLLNDFLRDWNRKNKLVIFARFIPELLLIKKICDKNKFSNYIYHPKEAHMDFRFQEEDHPQISISQITRGISRTLTRADTAIFFSRTFSYIDYAQAMARIEARGERKGPVTPVFLLTKGTIDEDIDDVVVNKTKEADNVRRIFGRIKKRLDVPSKIRLD